MNTDKYKSGIKAYGLGFLAGSLTAIGICIVIGKMIYTLPIILGATFGAIAFKLKKNEHKTK